MAAAVVPDPAPAATPVVAVPPVEVESLESFLALDPPDFPILDQLFQSVQVRQGFPSGPRTMPGGRGVLLGSVEE